MLLSATADAALMWLKKPGLCRDYGRGSTRKITNGSNPWDKVVLVIASVAHAKRVEKQGPMPIAEGMEAGGHR